MKRLPALALILVPFAVFAQVAPETPKKITYTMEADTPKPSVMNEEEKTMAFYRYPVGKTYWFKPGFGQTAAFYQSIYYNRYRLAYDGKFTPNTTVAFKVTELVTLSDTMYPKYAYRVVIEDGTPAMMELSALGFYDPKKPPEDRGSSVTTNPRVILDTEYGVITAQDPETLRPAYEEMKRRKAEEEQKKLAEEAEAKRQEEARLAKAEREYKRKGGVRIGMNAKQVRASNWGAPASINRTTDAYGVHEQWVYGGGNYLYFDNGILKTIQN